MRTAELVMEHSSKAVIEPAIAPTGIKTILVHVQNDDGLADRMQVALSMARAFGAHLHLLHVTPIEAYTVTDAFAAYVNPNIVEVLEDEAAKLRHKLEQQLTKEDVSWDYEEITSSLMPHLIQRAALADVVLIGREPHDREFGAPAITLLGDMLYRIRTPLLIAGDQARKIDPFGPAVVAWNGSYEAANALRAAVPLLRLSSLVRLVSIEEPRGDQFPSTDALEYLSRHGIHADLLEPLRLRETFAEELVGQAESDGASYMVMGGYSHTRAGEFLFGGVTRSLLQKCPISLLMAH
jgi:nucleotide-binding universal stress UspA family protein